MASAFKTLFSKMIDQKGDFSKIDNGLKGRSIKCFVKEVKPFFLISDGSFYVAPYFTEGAISAFSKKGHFMWQLKDKIITIDKWSLDIRQVNSQEIFTSYANIEVRFIIHAFKTSMEDKISMGKSPANLFRDDEFKTQILAFEHSVMKVALEKKIKGNALVALDQIGKSKVPVTSQISLGDGNFFQGYEFVQTKEKLVEVQDLILSQIKKTGGEKKNETDVKAAKQGLDLNGQVLPKS